MTKRLQFICLGLGILLFAGVSISQIPFFNSIKTSQFRNVVESVNEDSLYAYLNVLTGETPFYVNGQSQTIETRYSYSPQILLAEEFITQRFESWGYNVEKQSFILNTFYDIKFVPGSETRGWICTEGRIFGTTDSGATWNVEYDSDAGNEIWSLYVVSSETIFAVGSNGLLCQSGDGGATWQRLNSPTTEFLFGIAFVDENIGWICGDDGLIFKTMDGGTTWNEISTPSSSRLYDIFFLDNDNGWCVGRNGTVLYSNDGGETWVIQATPTNTRLYGVHFLTPTKGFVVGWNGSLLRTDDGGVNWTARFTPADVNYYDIDFIDENNGMIAGWDGTVVKTTDGGVKWEKVSGTGGNDLYGMEWVSDETVWVCGETGVYQTTDGGGTWMNQAWNLQGTSIQNIIVTKEGVVYPNQSYIICAHYDATSRQNPSISAPGADDNGSGTAAVMEAARVMAGESYMHTVKFILFPGEEQGLHGSAAYAARAAADGEEILGAINLDMIGYDGDGDGLFDIHAGTGQESQALGELVQSMVVSEGLNLTPVLITQGATSSSDHASFWRNGYPAVLIIEDWSDHTPAYHTAGDVVSTLNASYFLEMSKLAIGSLAHLANQESASVESTAVEKFYLHNPFPNPFNATVFLSYDLPARGYVDIVIVDMLGRHISYISSKEESAGQHYIAWNATDDSGQPVPSGIYFIQIGYDDQKMVRKTVLLR